GLAWDECLCVTCLAVATHETDRASLLLLGALLLGGRLLLGLALLLGCLLGLLLRSHVYLLLGNMPLSVLCPRRASQPPHTTTLRSIRAGRGGSQEKIAVLEIFF